MFFSFDFSGKPNLTPAHKQLLQQQLIDKNGPGPILHDFETLLDFIGSDSLNVSKRNHFLPMSALGTLNAQLTHPIELGLKRPRQKSYPHLNGLYLLLRATGITRIGGPASKPLLLLDDEILSLWQDLNPTERYFSLLEAWLIRGDPDIIGEGSRFFGTTEHISKWADFFRIIVNRKLETTWSDDLVFLRYYPGLYNLALLELFGLTSVQHGPPEQGKAWHIKGLARTPFGKALLFLLLDYVLENRETFMAYDLDAEIDIPDTVLQAAIQPYFPEWQNTLVIPKPEFQDGLYIFKVSLGQVWRQIALPGHLTLEDLSNTILNVYAFDYDHLYQFTYVNHFGVLETVNHPYMDADPWASNVLIGDLGLKPGLTMGYQYDFGDNWQFALTLERIDPLDAKISQPALLKKHGQAPEQYPTWDE